MRKTFVRFVIVLFVHCTLLAFGKACGPSEYQSDTGVCCPMCNIGTVVIKDCEEETSTTCKPCAPGTFISEPNGLHKCFTCKNCAESQGLYIQNKCSTIKDTVCGVLDGYYCKDYSNSQCSYAVKHRVCEQGQQTKTPGTKNSDTVCEDCPPGFYSPLGLSCTKWTNCTARNEIQSEKGSSVKDVTCTPKRRERYGLISVVVLASIVCGILCLISQSTSCKPKYPVQEMSSAGTTACTQNSSEETIEK